MNKIFSRIAASVSNCKLNTIIPGHHIQCIADNPKEFHACRDQGVDQGVDQDGVTEGHGT